MADFLNTVKADEQLYYKEVIGVEDGVMVEMTVSLQDKDKNTLCSYKTEDTVLDKKLKIPFKIDTIAKENNVEIMKVAFAVVQVDVDEELVTEPSKKVFLEVIQDVCAINPSKFIEKYRKLDTLNKESIVNLKKLLITIIEYYKDKDMKCNIKYIAYMLATVKHETANTFKPITEYGGKSYFNRYDPILATTERRRQRAIQMGNTQEGDGYKYRGRGFVQLTWKKNYEKIGIFLGIDLLDNPDLVLEFSNATKIMIYGMEKGFFTGKRLSQYMTKTKTDYYNARKIINGIDKASTIKNYAVQFEKCLRFAQ